MKKSKFILVLVIAAVLTTTLLTACAQQPATPPAAPHAETPQPAETPGTPGSAPQEPAETEPEPAHIRLGALRGPGGMGMVKLLDDAQNGLTRNTYEYLLGGSPDELTPQFLQGNLDIIAVPSNLASIIYNNTNGAARIISVVSGGIFYIVEFGGEEVHSIADLKDREMFSAGRGAAPDFAMRFIFEENGMSFDNDIYVDWRVEPTEILALMSTMEHALALLPQPFVTVAQTQLPGLRIAIDLNEEWNALDTDSQFVTTVLIARTEFLEQNLGAVEIFLEEFAASTDFVNNNLEEGAALIEQFGIIAAPIAQRAIPYCNLVSITGPEMMRIMRGYLEVLYGIAPQSIGGALPSDDFYHGV
ncbi:MAG: ABC transporter substrate-binding protein [Oscillospiraceae bacterium]|nr:ABC transporter substrate-binding protein [Oscillospiraceae bacterium]